MTTLLIDADVVAVRAAIYCETKFDFGDGEFIEYHEEDLDEYIDTEIQSYCDRLKTDTVICALSSPVNFRKSILPSYKANRPPKPLLHPKALQYIRDNYTIKDKEGLEGDDILGILATHPKLIKGKKIVVSIDKDLNTIPCTLFNPDKDSKPKTISETQADRMWMKQTLMGDTVDNYKGCPGIGEARATAMVEEVLDWGTPWATNSQLLSEMWNRVIAMFEKKGLTEEDALVQARVSRICRHTDFDFKTGEVKLWLPS